jgi:hypothetical protein
MLRECASGLSMVVWTHARLTLRPVERGDRRRESLVHDRVKGGTFVLDSSGDKEMSKQEVACNLWIHIETCFTTLCFQWYQLLNSRSIVYFRRLL